MGTPPLSAVLFNVVRIILRYGDIRLSNMKFLFPVIEKYLEKFKNFNNPVEFLNFFSHSGRASRTLHGPTPLPQPGGFRANVELKYSLEPPVTMVAGGLPSWIHP